MIMYIARVGTMTSAMTKARAKAIGMGLGQGRRRRLRHWQGLKLMLGLRQGQRSRLRPWQGIWQKLGLWLMVGLGARQKQRLGLGLRLKIGLRLREVPGPRNPWERSMGSMGRSMPQWGGFEVGRRMVECIEKVRSRDGRECRNGRSGATEIDGEVGWLAGWSDGWLIV